MIDASSPYLDSPNERIVANTVEALGQSASRKCMDLILPKLMSRNNRVKANAAMALFAAGPDRSDRHAQAHAHALGSRSCARAPLSRSAELTMIADHESCVALEDASADAQAVFGRASGVRADAGGRAA